MNLKWHNEQLLSVDRLTNKNTDYLQQGNCREGCYWSLFRSFPAHTCLLEGPLSVSFLFSPAQLLRNSHISLPASDGPVISLYSCSCCCSVASRPHITKVCSVTPTPQTYSGLSPTAECSTFFWLKLQPPPPLTCSRC